ncbi:MAG: HAD family phosphatase [Thiolinea sp.]
MVLKAVLFDHDGTLVDSEGVHYQMWLEVLKPYGVSISADQYMRIYSGLPTIDNAIDLIERFQLSAAVDDLVAKKLEIAHAYLKEHAFPLMAGAQAILDYFQQQPSIRQAIVTGAGAQIVNATVRSHALADYFSTIVSYDDVEHSKPAPDCYLLAQQRLGLDASECIAIEDTEHGVASAVAAGIACIAIPNAQSQRHDFSKAVVVLPNLEAAQAWIQQRYQLTV